MRSSYVIASPSPSSYIRDGPVRMVALISGLSMLPCFRKNGCSGSCRCHSSRKSARSPGRKSRLSAPWVFIVYSGLGDLTSGRNHHEVHEARSSIGTNLDVHDLDG